MNHKVQERFEALRNDDAWEEWCEIMKEAPRSSGIRAGVIKASVSWVEDPERLAVKRYLEEEERKAKIFNLSGPDRAKHYQRFMDADRRSQKAKEHEISL
jgi:hypothetical protein